MNNPAETTLYRSEGEPVSTQQLVAEALEDLQYSLRDMNPLFKADTITLRAMKYNIDWANFVTESANPTEPLATFFADEYQYAQLREPLLAKVLGVGMTDQKRFEEIWLEALRLFDPESVNFIEDQEATQALDSQIPAPETVAEALGQEVGRMAAAVRRYW